VEKIKKVIQNLECTSDKQELLYGNIEYRPWGYYENLVIAVGYKIKRIVVKESSKLSLQSHKFRSEQWTVIKGRARVTVQEKVFDLDQGQSTYIPIEAKHRLENCTDKPLEIIEIQIGECLEESDIKRFEDIYGRNLI
jgi:mannose-6-phosphate isomerase-like protein (cupin superfamily)